MKSTKKQWLRAMSYLLQGIFALLGFSACSSMFENEQLCEYGTPYARYEVKIKAVDLAENPVAGIQLTMKGVSTWKDGMGNTYTQIEPKGAYYTDEQGFFAYKDEHAWPNSMVRVIWNDMDKQGTAFGRYKTDSVDVDMGKLTGATGHWYEGSASKDVIIHLEKKATDAQ